jgi:hypothetical protein
MLSLKASLLLRGTAALAVSLAASAVLAQTAPAPQASVDPQAPVDAQTTAIVAQPQAAAAQSDSIDSQIAAWTQAPPQSGDGSANPANAGPRQIHGEAGLAFGSSGYRAGYITTDIPIGKDSDLGIAVGESEFKPKHFGTIKNQSLAISLRIGGGNDAPLASCGGETIRTDERYLEPLWVARQRGAALARDQQDCAAPVVTRAAQ